MSADTSINEMEAVDAIRSAMPVGVSLRQISFQPPDESGKNSILISTHMPKPGRRGWVLSKVSEKRIRDVCRNIGIDSVEFSKGTLIDRTHAEDSKDDYYRLRQIWVDQGLSGRAASVVANLNCETRNDVIVNFSKMSKQKNCGARTLEEIKLFFKLSFEESSTISRVEYEEMQHVAGILWPWISGMMPDFTGKKWSMVDPGSADHKVAISFAKGAVKTLDQSKSKLFEWNF